MTKPLIKSVVLSLAILGVTACSSQPPKQVSAPQPTRSGEEMLRESQGIAQLGERWLSGKKKVEAGEELIRQGQATITEGQRQIDEGRRIMKESEAGYHGIKQ